MAHQGVVRSLRQQALRCRLLHGGAGGAQRREMCCTPGGARELTIYDSVSRATRVLPRPAPASHGVPLITWYSCGPTVYDDAHLGHARTYVALDVARRVTEYLTHAPVHYVMGITDVDDKIIARAKERGCAPEALARDMEHRFWEDMHALNVMPPTQFTRVSEHIQDVVAYIQGIERNGFAYATPDGVYFDVHAFGSRYGKLMPSARHGTLAEDGVDAGSGERGTPVGAAHKRSARDFALWKAAKAGEPAWPSPWGAGRPGWHIECSAMTHAAVGNHLHVHAGGIDLAFPHHCNEIAQCEAHRGAEAAPPWVDIFMHTGHLYIAGCKMSKSLKNFVTVRQLLHTWRDAPHIADAFRLFCMSHHYRSNLNYHDGTIARARARCFRFPHTPSAEGGGVLFAFASVNTCCELQTEFARRLCCCPSGMPPSTMRHHFWCAMTLLRLTAASRRYGRCVRHPRVAGRAQTLNCTHCGMHAHWNVEQRGRLILIRLPWCAAWRGCSMRCKSMCKRLPPAVVTQRRRKPPLCGPSRAAA
ncbi:cysteine--tRNA ligase [archaeon]|nr:MAG: cysteine--tRNA ligase [archaeon]